VCGIARSLCSSFFFVEFLALVVFSVYAVLLAPILGSLGLFEFLGLIVIVIVVLIIIIIILLIPLPPPLSPPPRPFPHPSPFSSFACREVFSIMYPRTNDHPTVIPSRCTSIGPIDAVSSLSTGEA
jgi:hypothetical protein